MMTVGTDQEHRISEYILSIKTFLSVIPDTIWPGITFESEDCDDTPHGGIRVNLPTCSKLLNICHDAAISIKICYKHGCITFSLTLKNRLISKCNEDLNYKIDIFNMMHGDFSVDGIPVDRKIDEIGNNPEFTSTYTYHTGYHDLPISTFLKIVNHMYCFALHVDELIISNVLKTDEVFRKSFPDIDKECGMIISKQLIKCGDIDHF